MYLRYVFYLLSLLVINQINCSKKQEEKPLKSVFVQIGIACWYGPGFQGKRTASGESFDMNLLTAAHNKLEFGTLVKVTNLSNKKQVITEINDRGPFSKTRILDLSKKAAKEIGLIETGYANVKIEIVGYKEMNNSALIKHFNNIRMIKLGGIAKK